MSDDGTESEVIVAPITVTLDSVERMVGAGSLRMLAHITISCGDVELKCNGVQVVRNDKGWQVRSPTYRGANGISKPSLELPQEVWNQVLELLAEIVTDDADPRTGIR
jgi:hypothetical protein